MSLENRCPLGLAGFDAPVENEALTPMTHPLTILGIETSCDETAAAVVRGVPGGEVEILSNVIFSQIEEHAPYGGVVPEIAARAHIEKLDLIVEDALARANLSLSDLDGIAGTAGPGLIGGVIVGLMTAKGLAAASGKPFLPINHLEGHALSVRMTEDVAFPYLLLLVSGGHCQLVIVEGVGNYTPLGTTIDDAAGEAFDKTAKLLGLGFPGGPAVERAARKGDPKRFDLPAPMVGRHDFDFSFSGLKTAVRLTAEREGPLDAQGIADLCASFQRAVTRSLTDRTRRALAFFQETFPDEPPRLVVAGGVAANTAIREGLTALAKEKGATLHVPPVKLCTDNGAMIAWAGLERQSLEGLGGSSGPLDAPPKARWPLTDMKTA